MNWANHHGGHRPPAVDELWLLVPLQVLRNLSEAEWVEPEVAGLGKKASRSVGRDCASELDGEVFDETSDSPGGGAVEVGRPRLAGHPVGGHGEAAGGGTVGRGEGEGAGGELGLGRGEEAGEEHGAAPQSSGRHFSLLLWIAAAASTFGGKRRGVIQITGTKRIRKRILKRVAIGWYPLGWMPLDHAQSMRWRLCGQLTTSRHRWFFFFLDRNYLAA